MATVSYAFREDSCSIFLLEDAGRCYEDYCQVTVFGRNLIRPEFFRKYLFFSPYSVNSGKYRGRATKVQISCEDNQRTPMYDYVAVIESEVEFVITSSVMRELSQTYMPAWGVKSYLDYFSDKVNGILLFLRVYKVDRPLDPVYLEKGTKGSAQIIKLYDINENEISLNTHIMSPVISDNKFTYLKDEIIHFLKVENAFIAEYDSSDQGLNSLKERVEVEKLLHGTHQKWENRHLQWIETGENPDPDFDMAQLDYDSIYREVLELYPGMDTVIEYVKNIQPARLGEYDYVLRDIHENDDSGKRARSRLFDMSLRSAVKNALSYYHKDRLDLEDVFQVACIGVILAIEKYNDNVEGLFPSYAAMWMIQMIGRELPLYEDTFRIPVHYKDTITQNIRCIEENCGKLNLNNTEFEDFYHLLTHFTDCNEAEAFQMASVLIQPASIEEIYTDADTPDVKSIAEEYNNRLSGIEKKWELETVSEGLTVLTARERDVIVHRYGFYGYPELSLEEVGKKFGITRERVRQIEFKAQWKILSYLKRVKYITKEQYENLTNSRFEKLKYRTKSKKQ